MVTGPRLFGGVFDVVRDAITIDRTPLTGAPIIANAAAFDFYDKYT